MNAVVLTAYRIPEQRVHDHFEWNHADYLSFDGPVYLNVHTHYSGLPSYVNQFVWPWPVHTYCAGRMTNRLLRHACQLKCDCILRTDIDIAFDGILFDLFQHITHNIAVVPLYFMAESYARRRDPCYCAYRAEGTVGMTTSNWQRLCGYDERMTGYTCDDGDLVIRARALDIHALKFHHIYHIAHAGGPQQDAWTPGAQGDGRSDQWNPDIHPLNLKGNLDIMRNAPPWYDPDWGLHSWEEG